MTTPPQAKQPAPPPLALAGLKVLDLSRLAPGPYCSMLLADMGADVLLVEEAGTPGGRRSAFPPPTSGPLAAPSAGAPDDEISRRRSASRNTLGRNKRSLRLNLKTADAREIFYRLADDADIVLEGFRPGVVQRLAADYPTLSARNSRLIYCALSGFGQDGPYAQRVGHDINYIALGGALGMIGSEGPGGRPAIPANIIADFAGGGLMAAFAILCAVVARSRTGRGQYIDVAMSDGVLSLITAAMATHFASGHNIEPRSFVLNGEAPYYNVYETSDGRWFTVGAVEPWFFANLCAAMGRPDFSQHHTTADPAIRREIHDHFAAQFKTKSADDWFRILNETDVCAAPVLTLAEAVADPHNRARSMIIEVDGPHGPEQQIGIGPKLSHTPGRVRSPAPSPGQHTDAVLRDLGLDLATITRYREYGVVA